MELDFTEALTRLQGILIDAIVMVPLLLIAAIVFVLTLLMARYLRDLVVRLVHASHRPESLATVLSRLTRWSVIGLGIMLAALIIFPGFSAGELVQLLGLGGLAVGFAFRSIFEDFLAGILLLLNQPFDIGDQIIVQDAEGTIEDIQARITTIRTYDGRRIIIPNSDLFTNTVTVNTAYPFRRVEHDIGIGYGDDIARACKVILETLGTIEGVLEVPRPEALVSDLADSAVVIRIRWWIKPPRRQDLLDTRHAVLSRIRVALLEHGIDLPFPTQQVLFHDQTEATDGDRRTQREGWPPTAEDVPASRSIAGALHSVVSHSSSGPESENL